jgi:hypothetical protein
LLYKYYNRVRFIIQRPFDLLYYSHSSSFRICQCGIWHHSITVAQSDRLEGLQKRAMHIISAPVWDMPYPFALLFLDLESLRQRRINQGKKFFGSMCKTDNCLNHLLPPKRSIEIVSRLRYARTYPTHVLSATVLSLIMHY